MPEIQINTRKHDLDIRVGFEVLLLGDGCFIHRSVMHFMAVTVDRLVLVILILVLDTTVEDLLVVEVLPQ